MPEPPWQPSPRGVQSVVDSWLSEGRVRRCLAAERLLESAEATYAPIPAHLAAPLRRALKARGIDQLYSHQTQAIEATREGRHVVIATPTASGKSLCFHLPVLQRLIENPSSRALYLYPTKALSRDQEHSVRQMARDADLKIPATVYDGDTPGDARRAARENCRIVLTNPDMLHAGILPSHARWSATFEELDYVVLDEMHTYRGVFGSHMAHVIARLKRVAQFHGSNPKFICATATIGNPRAHAARLLGVPADAIELVDRSGAPRASRQFFLYNPPVVNEELGIRASALKRGVELTADLVRAKVPTIVFGQSRNSVEVMLKYLRDAVGDVAGPDAIMAYRGGYLPETRRRVENGLRNGEILCVVATNALELGIDIGDLEAVVCVGYPGSVAGTWQRFGRAGRRGSTSIALMVCSSSSLDQFFAQQPEYLLTAGAEEARIDPSNVEILIQHLKCAGFEAPFDVSDAGPQAAHPQPASGEQYLTLDPEATRDALEYLKSHGLMHSDGSRYHYTGDAFPANHVSLRNIGWDNFVIIDVATDKTLAELDWRSAHTMLHEQAIYQHNAEQFQVERLDYDNHKAFVRSVKPDYFTTALTYRTVTVLDELNAADLGPAQIGFGEVKVIEKVTGYKKIKYFTHENSGYGDVHLPEMQMHTVSFWLTLPEPLIERLAAPRAAVVDGLRGFGTALETVATIALMCEPSDINRTLGDGWDDAGRAPGREPARVATDGVGQTGGMNPTLFLFDAIPGGVGLSDRIFERASTLVRDAAARIQACSCHHGCPGCIGPDPASTTREVGRKLLAQAIGAILS